MPLIINPFLVKINNYSKNWVLAIFIFEPQGTQLWNSIIGQQTCKVLEKESLFSKLIWNFNWKKDFQNNQPPIFKFIIFYFYSLYKMGNFEIWEYVLVIKGLSVSSQFCDTKTFEFFFNLKIFTHHKRMRCLFSVLWYRNIENFSKIIFLISQIYTRNEKKSKTSSNVFSFKNKTKI